MRSQKDCLHARDAKMVAARRSTESVCTRFLVGTTCNAMRLIEWASGVKPFSHTEFALSEESIECRRLM